MYRLADYFKFLCLLLGIVLSHGAFAADKFPGIGRDATPAEVAAWDIDVRPDFKGLRKGSGTTARGQEIWRQWLDGGHDRPLRRHGCGRENLL